MGNDNAKTWDRYCFTFVHSITNVDMSLLVFHLSFILIVVVLVTITDITNVIIIITDTIVTIGLLPLLLCNNDCYY